MTLAEARKILNRARRVVALTGAGMSAESGVPTFRGLDGLWRNCRPEELATPEAFARNPQLVWEWYEWRRNLIRACEPHAGHKALAARGISIITQNVDGLHQRAGSEHVIELHGNIFKTTQTPDGQPRPGVVWFGEPLPPLVWEASVEAVLSADLLFVIGTSGVVYPAAQLAPIARENGALVWEFNLENSTFNGPCGETLPKLLQ
jgi:NAD-dependent deacetylase